MNQQPGPQLPLVFSYLEQRKAIGIIGLALPFVLAIGKILLQGDGIQPTISSYYYTDMGNVFVGSLCAIGVFFLSYKGYPGDRIPGYLASAFAVGVALFPEAPQRTTTLIGKVHLAFAALLFLTLAGFCLFLFTKTHRDKDPTPRKLQRNKIYRACGIIILISIALILVVTRPSIKPHLEPFSPVFWLEALADVSFGFAWFVKGATLLKDQ